MRGEIKGKSIVGITLGLAVLCVTSAQADFTLLMRDLTGGSDGNPNSTTEAETIIALEAPNATYQYTDYVQSPNPDTIDNGGGGNYSPTAPLPSGSQTAETYVQRATANIVIPAGDWTIGFGRDDGGYIRIGDGTDGFPGFINEYGTTGDPVSGDNEIYFNNTGGHNWTRGTFTLTSPLSTTIDALMFESGGGDSWEIAIHEGHTTGTPVGDWVLLQDGAKGWTVQVAPLNDTNAPSIARTAPAQGATGVYPGSTDLVATFDEEVVLTGSGSITLTDSTHATETHVLSLPDGRVSVFGTDLTISLTNDLEFGTAYEVTIASNVVEDTWSTPNIYAGTASGEWTFTTAVQDLTAPTISVKSPDDEETDVPPNANIVATFSVPVLADTGDITIVDTFDGADTRTIAVTNSQVSFAGNVMTIDLSSNLLPERTYAFQIAATAVKNYSEVNFAGVADTTTWNFKTIGGRLLTWDPAGTGGSDGNGTWLDAGEWWDGVASANWLNSSPDSAVIGSGGAGGTITLGAVTAGTVLIDNFTGTYTLANGGTLDQSGGITIGTNAGNVNLPLAISGTGGLTVKGDVRVNLRDDGKTFSGDLVINAGEVLDYQFNDLGTGNLNINGGVLVGYWGEWMTRTLGSGAGQVQVPGGESGFCGQGRNGSGVRFNNSNSYVVQWGSTYFNPSVLVLQSPWANTNGKLSWSNPIDLNGAQRIIAVNKDDLGTGGFAALNGIISNSDEVHPAGLTKTGPGILILSAANTYDGATIVNEGTLQVAFANTSNDNADVTIASSGATLELDFVDTDTVAQLIIGTTTMDPGVYGVGNIEIPQITGTGTLTVTGRIPPGTAIVIR